MSKKIEKKKYYNIEYVRLDDNLFESHHIKYFIDYFDFVICLKRMLDGDIYRVVSVYKDDFVCFSK